MEEEIEIDSYNFNCFICYELANPLYQCENCKRIICIKCLHKIDKCFICNIENSQFNELGKFDYELHFIQY